MTGALAISIATAFAWFAVYRYPFGPRARTRIGLAVGGALGQNATVAFTVFATVWYVGFGAAFAIVQALATGVSLSQLLGAPPAGTAVWALCLAVVGCVGCIGISMSALRALWPTLDTAAAVTDVPWVRATLAIRPERRWLVPLMGAVVEEVFYRGTVFIGLRNAGFGTLTAAVVTTVLFTVTQMGMTQTSQQAAILAASSIVVSTFGCLLVLSTTSVLPAVALHGAFAAYYARSSWTLSRFTRQGTLA